MEVSDKDSIVTLNEMYVEEAMQIGSSRNSALNHQKNRDWRLKLTLKAKLPGPCVYALVDLAAATFCKGDTSSSLQ